MFHHQATNFEFFFDGRRWQGWCRTIWLWTRWPTRPIRRASTRPNCRRRRSAAAGVGRTRAPCRCRARSIPTARRRRSTAKAPRPRSSPVRDSAPTAAAARPSAVSPTETKSLKSRAISNRLKKQTVDFGNTFSLITFFFRKKTFPSMRFPSVEILLQNFMDLEATIRKANKRCLVIF